ncbi:MAG: hypothetical protein Q9157_000335 [Trypethelium eluteriae]
MGETDNPSFLDRIRSDAHHSILPLRNEQSTSSASIQKDACLHNTISSSDNEKSGDHDGNPTGNSVADNTSGENPPPAPPPEVGTEEQQELAITTRLKNGAVRFVTHTREALTRSWINLLLVFVPAGIAVKAAGLNPSIVFALNAIAVIPLAGILTHATESVASRLGDTWGALLNVSFGNAVELIIFIIALVKNEIQIVQASLLGSILANLLLILGMAFLFGGLRFREQVLQISRGTSVVLLLVYVLYLLFQLKSHAYMYESTPQKIIDEESHPGVLAELMETSSESSDSSTGSDTDGSSSSHTTAKRIKRAFRNRRRRKSSASSTNTPSVVSSPGAEMTKTSLESGTKTGNGHLNGHFPRAALGDIMSGDEADTDANLPRRRSEPRVRDFQTEAGESSKSPVRSIDRPMQEKKKRKHKQKKHRKQSMKSPPTEHNEKEGTPGDNNFAPDESPQRQVGFVDEPQNSTPGPETSSAWRNLAIRQLSNRQSFRPGLPKVLSNTVFTTPPPGTSPALGPVNKPIPGSSNLRRTNSLPDRLNRPQPPAINSMSLPNPASVLRAASERTGPDYPSEEEDAPHLSRTSAIVMLLLSTGLVALCAEFLVDAIPAMTASSSVSQAFIGLIVLPIVGNAAEHVTAVTVATKNKMDLAIGVAVGSSIQIALFVTPLVVLLGWILGKAMSLYFNLFETISLFVTAFVVNFLVLDGRSNYLEGSLLIAAYVIIA